MLSTLLLDALSALGEANAMILLGKLLCTVLFMVVLPLWLLLHLWSRHIGKQFDREPKQAKQVKPAKQVRGAGVLLWLMVAVMVASFVALSSWS